MADIQAFRGLRYDLSRVGSLGSVVAPPYDVIDADLQQRLYDRSPYNVVRLILNRGDDLLEGQTIYERAAEHFKDWKKDGILKPDNVGSVYIYHQTFEFQGVEYTRRGFITRVRLERFGEGSIFPHEQTHAAAKEDRLMLMSACKANLSPVFGIFSDEQNEAQNLLEAAIEDRTPLQVQDDDGVMHQVWIVTDANAIAHVAQIVGTQPVFIADGHHRYETACNYRDALAQQQALDRDHPSNYVLMMLVGMSDPGLAVLPTHRLFRGVDPISSSQLIERLGPAFTCETVGSGPEAAAELWDLISLEQNQGTMGFYCRSDNQWVLSTDFGRGGIGASPDVPRSESPMAGAGSCHPPSSGHGQTARIPAAPVAKLRPLHRRSGPRPAGRRLRWPRRDGPTGQWDAV